MKKQYAQKSAPIYLSYLAIAFLNTLAHSLGTVLRRASIFGIWRVRIGKIAPKHRKQYELIRIKVEWESCWHVASMPVLLLRLMLCFDSLSLSI